MAFPTITNRETLIPPPVLPAQAPINISNTKMVLLKPGHISKSVVAKPVEEIRDATWNEASVNASNKVSYRPRISFVIKIMVEIVISLKT